MSLKARRFYVVLCGPPGLGKSMLAQLYGKLTPEADIHANAEGDSTLLEDAIASDASGRALLTQSAECMEHSARGGLREAPGARANCPHPVPPQSIGVLNISEGAHHAAQFLVCSRKCSRFDLVIRANRNQISVKQCDKLHTPQ